MLINDECIKTMKKFNSNIINVIFADPPYFLSNGGISISSGKIVSVNKGNWDNKSKYEDINIFTRNWLSECFRVLKHNGTIFVTGTHHNIFSVYNEMNKIGFKIINIIIWHKEDAPPLAYKNKFRFSHEMIIWAKKSNKFYFDYKKMFDIYAKEMEDVWTLPAVSIKEKRFGYHPTQKPECLLERIILASTRENDLILDPFMGSGTTCYVAYKNKRKYIGIEIEKEYFKIAKRRLESIQSCN